MTTEAEEAPTRPSTTALSAWTGIATLFGFASDLIRPLGNFTTIGLVVFLLLAIALFFGGGASKPPLRGRLRAGALFAAIGAGVFAIMFALQVAAPAAEEGEPQRGFLAQAVPALAPVQTALTGVEEPAPQEAAAPAAVEPTPAPAAPETWAPPSNPTAADYSAALGFAMGQVGDASTRLQAGKFALESRDAAFRASAIDRLYRSGDGALRQAAMIAIFHQNYNNPMPFIIGAPATEESAAMATALRGGASVRPVGTDQVSGAFRCYAFGQTSCNGTIGRSVVMITSELPNFGAVTVQLTPDDNFMLNGAVTDSAGHSVAVQLPLQ